MADTQTAELTLDKSDTLFCPCCGSKQIETFYSAPNVPTNSCILFETEESARACPTGDVTLGFCGACGFIYNADFEPEKTEYSGRYEETQGFSPTFSKFHTALAQRLIDEHGLKEKRVLEIGCGKGEFLLLLAQLGGNIGIGVDPGANPERIIGVDGADKVTLLPEYYTEAHGQQAADFIVCKMTLEHIPAVSKFLTIVRRSLEDQPDTTVFFQIPESRRILETCAFEDIYYEHCSYFSPGSLARVFEQSGFEVLKIGIEYGDQYLTIEAKPTKAAPPAITSHDDLSVLTDLVASFPDRMRAHQAKWRSLVMDAKSAGKSVLLWGSGSKAVSFLTSLDVGDAVQFVTDINPNRQNHYMPITGQRIVDPAELAELKPDIVIIMNEMYETEITADLNAMDLYPEIHCL